MNKNQTVTVEIIDMTSEGEGIGKVDGFPLFIKDALIGDVAEVLVIKVKKNYGYGRLLTVLIPSPDRVEAPCPVARQCGGCQLQALRYEKQLAFKRNKVLNNLRRIGGLTDVEVLDTLGMEEPWRYRNKAQVPFGRDKNGQIIAGFYVGRSHSIVDQEDCLLTQEVNGVIIREIKAFMNRYQIAPYEESTGTGLVRHVLIRSGFTTGEIMVCLVINGQKLPHADEFAAMMLGISGVTSVCLNVNQKNTNVILGDEIVQLSGAGYITDYIGDIQFQISPLSFFQVNPRQTKVLYETALAYAGLTGEETVWDLYCGIGTISLFLAQKAKMVYGVEIVEPAIVDARKNAAINGIENVEFFVGKAEEVLPEKYKTEGIRADVIVVDPPRKGCDQEVLETIGKMQPERVVYVSCDSATLARDLKVMMGMGYEVRKVQPVDMFGHGGHVETVVMLEKKAR